MTSITFQVKGMSCNHCVKSIEGALRDVGATGKVDLAQGTVTVQYEEGKLSEASLKETIEEQGYDVVG
ncbi:heavy-metal-associated domain-containing protein [Paenibacillus antri]|uniref:Heavy-metal-associated domain-containing protein n=1 Tax=Paenibacillus antri TaxID=2582848 RepID=A0A5R9G5B3_9BACL|nr:cation transporter [Paenibacillus antri]TLS50971.1 heavy-metal-associated domain-containing protein [Paenibacillus antri]